MTLLTQLTPEDFAQYTQQAPNASFHHSLEMASLYQKRGYQVTFLGINDGNEIVAAALTYRVKMTGGHLLAIDSGPVYNGPADLSRFYEGLKAYAHQTKALVVQVKPYDTYQTFDSQGASLDHERPELITQLTDLGYTHDGLYTGYPNGEASWNYLKDLSNLTPDNLVSSFSKKGKPLIKKAKSFGTTVRRLSREELHLFKDITASTSDRRQFNDKPLEYYEAFYDSFGDKAEFMVAEINFQTYSEQLKSEKERVVAELTLVNDQLALYPDSAKWKKKLQEVTKQVQSFDNRLAEAQEFVATYGDRQVIVAGALFIYMPQESYYLFSGSYTEFNQFYAPALLQEHAMLHSIALGIPTYNFLGVAGTFDNTDGVLRFKQNFNGYLTRKMGSFRYYPQPLKYHLISFIKKLLRR